MSSSASTEMRAIDGYVRLLLEKIDAVLAEAHRARVECDALLEKVRAGRAVEDDAVRETLVMMEEAEKK